MTLFSLLAYAVVVPMALWGLAWVFGAYWPVALLVLGCGVGLYRLARQAAQSNQDK